jgi:hypothetical protein
LCLSAEILERLLVILMCLDMGVARVKAEVSAV